MDELQELFDRRRSGPGIPAEEPVHLRRPEAAAGRVHLPASEQGGRLGVLQVLPRSLQLGRLVAQLPLGARPLGDVVRYPPDHRRGHALGAQRVPVLPDPPFPTAGLHQHQPSGGALAADGGDVVVELVAHLGSEDAAHVRPEQLGRLVSQGLRGPGVDR